MAKSSAITLEGPAGRLEAQLELPSGTPRFRAVVCHPHSLHGGSMDNKVVTTLTRACREAGGVALRFNCRGVGASQGRYDEGIGETEDLLAGLDWLAGEYPALPGWLAGFSFGAWVAARGAEALTGRDTPPVHLLLVAPPVHHYAFHELSAPDCPVTVAQGDEDEVVPPQAVYDWVHESGWEAELVRFQGAGHFFHGRLTELKELALRLVP